MTTKTSSHIDLALLSIKIFQNDGTIDMKELESLMALALQDGIIDDDEKETLRNIFGKVEEWDVTGPVWERMQEIRKKYGF